MNLQLLLLQERKPVRCRGIVTQWRAGKSYEAICRFTASQDSPYCPRCLRVVAAKKIGVQGCKSPQGAS